MGAEAAEGVAEAEVVVAVAAVEGAEGAEDKQKGNRPQWRMHSSDPTLQ